MTIIITAPHSLCEPNKPGRTCDVIAGQVAIELSERLDNLHISNILVLPEHSRSEIDYNRMVNRYSDYREKIEQEIKKYNPHLLLDIHSFPTKEDQDDMYILSAKGNRYKGKIPYRPGGDNDIVNTFSGEAYLIECYEKGNIDKMVDRIIEPLHVYTETGDPLFFIIGLVLFIVMIPLGIYLYEICGFRFYTLPIMLPIVISFIILTIYRTYMY